MEKLKGIEIIGVSKHNECLHQQIERAASNNRTVLIQGPSGTGKELIANNIHFKSQRKGNPFEIINCGAIPHDLFESELFGHKKGSFTGTVNNKEGKVEIADEGTLFLDEIGDLAPNHQVKILRFLEDGSFCAVGGTTAIKTNVRVIAATNKDLLEEIEKKAFREDLYYRLIGHPISTISLSKRLEDIIILVNHFIFKHKLNVDDRVKFLLYSYDLPGNVRELKSLLNYTYEQIRKYLVSKLVRQQKKQLNDTKEEAVDRPLGIKSLVRGVALEERKHVNQRLDNVSLVLNKLEPNEIKREILGDALRFTAQKNIDFGKIVQGYEIFQLRHRTNLSKEKIAKHLHIGKVSLSPKQFKTKFGFELPSKDRKYYLIDSPLSICKNRKPEPVRE